MGAKMAKARAWFYRHEEGGTWDIPGVLAEVNEARRGVQGRHRRQARRPRSRAAWRRRHPPREGGGGNPRRRERRRLCGRGAGVTVCAGKSASGEGWSCAARAQPRDCKSEIEVGLEHLVDVQNLDLEIGLAVAIDIAAEASGSKKRSWPALSNGLLPMNLKAWSPSLFALASIALRSIWSSSPREKSWMMSRAEPGTLSAI